MEPEAFEYALNSGYEYIYNNESELEPLQYPLAMSRFKVPRFANDLYTDDTSQYFTYSGTANSLIVTKEKDGRYKNLTLRAYSGDSFKFYFQAGSGIADSDLYFSGPLTTSGVYSTMTQYATQSGALTNAITFSAPTNNSSVYTLPSIQNLNWIRLFHQSTDGTTPYRIYQFLPRTLIQVDDLEADVIDAVTIRVSGSIVVSADDLAPGSITGDKIMAGTVSGVLITPGGITATQIAAGTITANQIAVSGITANRLNVSQLDAVAANMGNLVVNSGILLGTNGTIWAGAGTAESPTTGLKIYTDAGVSRLTTYSDSEAQIDIGSDGRLVAGTTVLDGKGITVGSIEPAITVDAALKIKMNTSVAVQAGAGLAFYDAAYSEDYAVAYMYGTSDGGVADPLLYVQPGISTTTLEANNVSATSLIATGDLGGFGGVKTFNGSVGSPSLAFINDPDTGMYLVSAGNFGFATGGVQRLLLTSTGATQINGNFLQFNYGGLFKNTAQTINAGADARINFQVSYTNGNLDDVANHRLFLTHAGLYVITAGVIGNFVHTWRVVTGGNFDTGHLMNGQVIPDMRAYVTKQVYLNANTELELWVRNTGGNNLAVTTGGNGTILTAAKVG